MFLAAKKVLRVHPDWTDEQVADQVGIPRAVMDEVLPQARQEVSQDG
jgi:predicted DNA-binding protein (UPF0251 family)